MAVNKQPPMAYSEATDLAQLWREALTQYYINTEQDLTTLPRFTSMQAVMNDEKLQKDAFNKYRHPETQVNKLRTVLGRNVDLIQKGAQYLAQAATPAFPPAAAILTAFTFMLRAAKDVTSDYERIISFYDQMNKFLERVSIIEDHLPSIPNYRRILMGVFSSLLNICGIATRYIAKGRFKKWFRSMMEGPDDELKGAYDDMETALKGLDSANTFTTVRNTEEIKYDTAEIKYNTAEIKVTGTATYENTEEIKTKTEDMMQMMIAKNQKDEVLYQKLQVTMKATVAEAIKQNSRTQNQASRAQVAPDAHKPKDPSAKKLAAFNQVKKKFAPKGDPSANESREIEFLFVKGTATWIFEHELYGLWIEDKGAVLWITGSPGIGKTCIAYSVVNGLKQKHSDEAHTSVASYYFREEQYDLRSVKDAISSAIFQVASEDRGYCEEVANKIHHAGDIDWENVTVLWNTFIAPIFTETSDKKLFLVLDGLDEALEDDIQEILELLKEIKTQKLNIHVLITSQQSFKEKLDALEPRAVKVTLDLISKDVSRLIRARIQTFSRLRKFSRQSKIQIRRKLREKADGMLYAEHVLRRLNSIGREGAALRFVRDSLPDSLPELYALLLTECQKRRTLEQFTTLKRLFAWLAFSKRPLTLSEATSLVQLIIGEDDLFSLDEEIEGKSARILGLGRDVTKDDDLGEIDDDPNDDDDATLLQSHADEDGSAPLRFQERSLRSYFREMDVNQGGLRTTPPAAHLTILEMAASILCKQGEDPQNTAWAGLQEYAAYYWADHLLEIDPDLASKDDTMTVLRSLSQIFLGMGNVSKSVETVAPEGYGYFECFWGDRNPQNHVLVAVRKWIQKAASMDPQEFVHDIAMFVKTKREEEMVLLARAHIQNWWQGAEDSYDTVKSFEFALSALIMVRYQSYFYSGLRGIR